MIRKEKKKTIPKAYFEKSKKGKFEKLEATIQDESLLIKSKPILMKAEQIKIDVVGPK